MKVTLWGTRGSLASAGPENVRYGGNTACVELLGADGTLLVLDAGTGIRRLGAAMTQDVARVDILLTHLHMDHIQGLGFFGPLYRPDLEVHVWGPPSAKMDLGSRLTKYLSPPLFPVPLRDLPCDLSVHDVPIGEEFSISGLKITAQFVCHPGATLGYRITENGTALAYLPDHEPALGTREFPGVPAWTSGLSVAKGVDLLIHDAQYSDAEYPEHLGWGHSSVSQALAFASAAGAKRLVLFHHDPGHSDATIDRIVAEAIECCPEPFEVVRGTEGLTLKLLG